jgi:hypothetical protein
MQATLFYFRFILEYEISKRANFYGCEILQSDKQLE